MNKSMNILTIALALFVTFTANVAAMDIPSAAYDVPVLERLRITAEALYECGDDNNSIASEIVNYEDLDRTVYLHPIEMGPNGMNLAKKVTKNVFFAEGAYTTHLNRQMQKRLTTAFMRVVWNLDSRSMKYFEVSSDIAGKIPGDGEIQRSPAALGIMLDGRMLILRGVAID